MKKLTPEIIEQLKSEHGEISLVEGLEHEIVVKCPTPGEYKRFRTLSAEKKTRDKGRDGLMTDCVVWPDAEEFMALTESRPGYPDTILNVVLDLAGIVQDAKASKL